MYLVFTFCQVEGLDMKLIQPGEIEQAIHGTYSRCWSSIARQGLSRMGRTHIHFALRESTDGEVISGLRTSAQILIYIDIDAAIRG